MKKTLSTLLALVMITTAFATIAPVSAASVEPDVLLTPVELFAGNKWIKHGDAVEHPDAGKEIFKYIPNATLSNGMGFEVDVPVESAKYAVVRYYTNVVAHTHQIAFPMDGTYDWNRQYGIASVINSKDTRVVVFDLSAAAGAAKNAGLTSIKYLKVLPWQGQSWGNNDEVDASAFYYNLYSIAFFGDSAKANAYAEQLKNSLPDIAEEEKYNNDAIASVEEAPSDATAVNAIINKFKANRTDAPFIKGYDNGTMFKPDGNMTRAEACTIITRLLTEEAAIKGKYTTTFTDVKAGAWYYDNIAYLESKGYLDAYSGQFKPDQKITRAEFVELIYKMGKIPEANNDVEVYFSDVPKSHPRYEIIMAAAKSGLVNGKTRATFDPDGDIKRSEVVKVICNALGRTPTKEGILNVDGFKDVSKEHWAYTYIIEASYRHSLTVQEDGSEKWNEIVENELIIYPEYPEQIDRNYDYEVTVSQGDKSYKIPVYNEVRQYSAGERNPYGDEYRRFAEFAFQGEPVRVDIKVNQSFSEYTLIPAIKDLPSTVNGNVISVYVNEPMQFVLRLGSGIESSRTMLAVFVDPPETNVPDKNDPNVIWIEGWHEEPSKELYLTEGKTLYIAPGAVLNTRVLGAGSNIKITGRGMVRDPYDTRANNVHSRNYNVNITNGFNILIEGIKIVDCRFYHLYLGEVRNSEVYNVKIFSNQISTDGFLISAYDTYVHDSFADVGDDVFTGGGQNEVYENMLVGSTCGIFSLSGSRKETYKNISIFRADEAIFKNYYGTGAFNGGVFENIYAIDCPYTPLFFGSRDQGTILKTFKFKNLIMNLPTGSVDKRVEFKRYNNRFINLENGGNFDFTFENLYIDGKLVISADELVVRDNTSDNTTTTINVTTSEKPLTNLPLVPNTTVLAIPYVAPEKTLEPLPVGVNLLAKYGGIENGLEPFATSGFSYFRETDDAHSGAKALYIPGTEGATSSGNNDIGISYGIYDLVERGGKGTYTLEFYAKLAPNSVGKDIYAGIAMNRGSVAKYQSMSVMSKYQICALTDEWQKFTVTFDLTSTEIQAAWFRLVSHSGNVPMAFLVDDISLTYTPAE